MRMSRTGLGQEGRERHAQRHAIEHQEPEDRLPAEQRQHEPAQQRRKDGRGAHHQHHARNHVRALGRAVQVAHHSRGDHHAGTRTQRLQEAPHDQRINRGGRGATDRRQHEQHHADQQHGSAAVAIGQRAIENLPDRQAQEERRQRQLHARGIGGKRLGQSGQRWQVHVHAERGHGRGAAQDERQTTLAGDGATRRAAVRRMGLGH